MPTGYIVSVDFGTSYTAAAVRRGDAVEPVDIEGNGRNRIPSCVFLDERLGAFETGRAARNSSLKAPDAFERTPKRLIGTPEKLLGDRLVPTVELVRAVFRRVLGECRGAQDPDELRITHPAGWSPAHLIVLSDAVAAAQQDLGWDVPVQLLSEPVAAAVQTVNDIPEGSAVAVYDLGGGTFDIAVVRRVGSRFEVVGTPGGKDRCGGEEFDELLLEEIGRRLGDTTQWQEILHPPSDGVALQRARLQLRDDVVDAKEQLSQTPEVVVPVRTIGAEVEITRAALESLLRDDIQETVTILLDTLADAARAGGLRDGDFAGVVLTGGASRMPLVEQLVASQTQLRVFTQPDRKGVVASGAARWVPPSAGGASLRHEASSDRTNGHAHDASPPTAFRCRLMVRAADSWKNRETRVLVGGGDLVVQESASAFKTLQRWAESTRSSLDKDTVVGPATTERAVAGTRGLQMWSLTTRPDGSAVKHLHRFALAGDDNGGRGILLVARETAAELADHLRLSERFDGFDHAPFVLRVPARAPAWERVSVVAKGRFLSKSDFVVFAESTDVSSEIDDAAWTRWVLARYANLGMDVTEASADTFLGGEPANYREVRLTHPEPASGAVWACWWTGIVERRAVAVALEARSPVSRDRAEKLRDVFALAPADGGGT